MGYNPDLPNSRGIPEAEEFTVWSRLLRKYLPCPGNTKSSEIRTLP